MSSNEIRRKFLEFFKGKGHVIIPGAPLIPENDPTVLFTTAGMHPLVPFLLGEKHPEGRKLVNFQKCVRTGDIEEVGDDTHLTFFEMFGNWSIGDPEKPDGIGAGYWKKEAIEWSFEFLTKELKIPIERLAISCFAGDKDAKKDDESAKIWKSLGIPLKRIAFLPKEDNWWGPAGQTGPCGPDTEMFYWSPNDIQAPKAFNPKDKRWVEIWNDVLMQYIKNEKGGYVEAKQKNVDTGMGLERTLAILNSCQSVYDTELFLPIIKKIEDIAEKKYQKENIMSYRIIADHLKTAAFILAEGIEPSNVERGYVLRRLIRRAIRYGRQLDIKGMFTFKISQAVIEIYRDVYPELEKNKNFIEEQLIKEEEKFSKTLEKGLKEIKKIPRMTGEKAFNIYETYGFPLEVAEEITKIENREGFFEALKKHQDLSRTASAGMFKGGLADSGKQATKYHTTTHLLLAALRQVLGKHVFQKGSNITAERLRLDFSHPRKMTSEEIKKVEEIVNQTIKERLEVKFEELSLEQAEKQGVMGVFGKKYGDIVKVYTIANKGTGKVFSKEICGGPHINNTSELGVFKILKEESSGSGIRRIKAALKGE